MKFAENATIAKACAVYGKRLKYNDYIELASCKKVTDAAEYLKKNTHFSKALSNIDTSTIHRGFLESILDKSYYDKYESLCGFQYLEGHSFYKFLLVRSEMRELLKAILYLNNESNDVYIESMHSYMIEKASFDLMALAKASDFESVLKVIRHTPYYDLLKNIKADSSGNIPYTKCEILLRTYYHKWLIENAEKNVHGKSKKILINQIYVHMDIINIINAYRMKKHFSADADTLKEHMIPIYGRLSKEKQFALFETQFPQEYLRLVLNTFYGRKMKNFSENMESEQFEREFIRIKYVMAKRALMFSQDADLSLYSLMYLFEVELNNVTNIIEGIRYEKSVSYIENLLVLE